MSEPWLSTVYDDLARQREAMSASRPSPDHILGLLFPHTATPSAESQSSSDDIDATAAKPTLVWVRNSTTVDEETSISFPSVDVRPFFKHYTSSSSYPDPLYSERNHTRHRENASMLEVWTSPPPPPSRKTTDHGGGPPLDDGENATIRAIRAERDRLLLSATPPPAQWGPYRWQGPVLAVAMTRSTGVAVDGGLYHDVRLEEDARDVLDFVLDYLPNRADLVKEELSRLDIPTRPTAAEGRRAVDDTVRAEEAEDSGREEANDRNEADRSANHYNGDTNDSRAAEHHVRGNDAPPGERHDGDGNEKYPETAESDSVVFEMS